MLRRRATKIGTIDGYTVIEMLIALTLLVTAMIPLAVMLSTSLKTTVKTSNDMRAREIAASEIDRVKGLKFDAVGISTAVKTFTVASNGEQVKPEPGYPGIAAGPTSVQLAGGRTYDVYRDVRKAVNSSKTTATATKKVVVKVQWETPAPGGSTELSTFIGPTDMAN